MIGMIIIAASLASWAICAYRIYKVVSKDLDYYSMGPAGPGAEIPFVYLFRRKSVKTKRDVEAVICMASLATFLVTLIWMLK